jgi:signal peptidase II
MARIVNWFRHAWLVLLVAGIVILLDQASKYVVRINLPKFSAVSVIGDYFMWEHVDNYGAAFGILQNTGGVFPILGPIIALAVSIAILVYVRYIPTEKHVIRIFLGLQLGGAIGNALDRVYQGYVTDFIKMGIPGVYYWPNYNIADTAVVVGVVGLAGYIIWEDVAAQRKKKQEAEQTRVGQPKLNAEE